MARIEMNKMIENSMGDKRDREILNLVEAYNAINNRKTSINVERQEIRYILMKLAIAIAEKTNETC